MTQECNLSQVHILHLLSLKFCFYILTTLHISTSYITIVLLPIIYFFCKAKVVRRKSMKVFAQVFWIVFSIWVHTYKCKVCTYVFPTISLQSTCLQIHTYYVVPQLNVIKMTLFHVYLAITVTNLSFITLYALFNPIMITRWPKLFYVCKKHN